MWKTTTSSLCKLNKERPKNWEAFITEILPEIQVITSGYLQPSCLRLLPTTSPAIVLLAYQSRDGCKTSKQIALLLEGKNNLGWEVKSLFYQLKLINSMETLIVQCHVLVWGEPWIIQKYSSEILQMRVS